MKLSRARVAFQVLLHVVLAGHVLAYYFLGWRRIGALDFQAFFHYFLGDGLVTAGVLLTAAMLVLTAIFGRLFCSWGCHFGATQDFAAWVMKRLGWRAPLVRTRFLHLAPYVVLAVVFLAPAVERWTGAGWGPVRVDISAVAPWDTLPGWLLSTVTFAACGGAILLFLGTRGFCRFVCPYGAVFRVLDRAALFRVRRVAACGGGCAPPGVPACTASCPTAIDVHAETGAAGRVTSADCVRCNLCIEACPSQALAHVTAGEAIRRGAGGFHPIAIPVRAAASMPPRRYDLPAWGEGVVLAVAAATYIAADLVYGGHFLAAVIGLGEGFLALLVLRALSGDRGATALGLPLRSGRGWTFLGVSAAGAFLLSLVPLFEAGAFKWLRREGLRLDPFVASALAEAAPRAEGPARESLAQAAEKYRAALEYLPSDLATRRLLLGAYVRLGDSRALDEAEELRRRTGPGDEAAEHLLEWVRRRFSGPGGR